VSKKNRKKKQTRPQSSAPAKFSPTTMVRVKPGTLDPDFADIPLGGWKGTIQEIDQTTDPRVYLVHWNQETLDQMHPVFRKRCQRDDLEIESMWLGEDDLELDTGEPARIEQPTSLITRSLSKNDQDDRIRAIFDLTSDDPLPEINEDNLRKYHRYLATHLSLPFKAKYSAETIEDQRILFTVTGLLDPENCNDDDGVQCEATDEGEEVELPLADLESTVNIHNRQLIEDYAYWFHNFTSEGNITETFGSRTSTTWMQIGHEPIILSRWAYFKVMLFFGVVEAISGFSLGSLLAAMEIVQIGAIAGAVVLGLLGCFVGTRFGRFFGVLNQKPHRSLYGGIIGAVAGVILGALIGSMLGAIVGILIGIVIGGFVSGWFWRGPKRMLGAVLGAILGAAAQAFYFDHDKAMEGAVYGAGIGAIAGVVIFLAILGLMWWLGRPRSRR